MSVFTYSLIDEAGVRGSVPVFVDHATTLTVAQLAIQAVAIGNLIDAITGAVIEDVAMTLHVVPDAGWKSTAIANVDMEQCLLLSFQIGSTFYSDSYVIPALRDTLIVDGRPVLTATEAIDDFRQAVTAGTGLTDLTIETKLLDSLTDLVSAAVTFRSKRKNRKAVSKIVNPA